VISGNDEQGLAILNSGTIGNVVAGNYIGVGPDGTTALSNAWQGVAIFGGAQSNTVGGSIVGARNILSGNGNQGVAIVDAGTSGNVISGNFIGLNAAGTGSTANDFAGVGIWGGAQSNLVGGYTASARNIVSGNDNQGITISDPGTMNNVVAGNYIGTGPDGATAISNAWSGIAIFNGAQSNLVGGNLPSARNIISGNGNQGVIIVNTNTSANIVAGNYIGLNAAGTAAVPNAWTGAEMFGGADGNAIGGTSIGTANVISGNGNYGVAISDDGTSGNLVEGNIIGLDPSAKTAFANAFAGVAVFNGAQSNTIGGLAFAAGNIIASNLSDGIQFWDTTSNNTARANSIFGNSGIGIVLYNGGNLSAASPALSSAAVTTSTSISGTLMSAPSTSFQVDLYSSAASPAQGMVYLGAVNATTGGGGMASFTANLPVHVPAGRIITATATDPNGNTSGMSTGVTVTMVSSVNDGIPDAWRAQYFGGNGTTTNNLSCATCDADGDGLNNWQKFIAGLNPTNSAGDLRLTALKPNGSNDVARFLSAPGTVYRVLYRDNVANSFWSVGADQVIGTGTNIFIPDPNAFVLPERFYWLQVLW
jgi:titin